MILLKNYGKRILENFVFGSIVLLKKGDKLEADGAGIPAGAGMIITLERSIPHRN